jgi:hypothetical protein
MSQDYTKELGILGSKLGEILVMVVDQDKIETAAGLMNKYSKEFHDSIQTETATEKISEQFDHFINSEMSVVETLGVSDKQFKPVRKLLLNEMYKFRKDILKLEPKEPKKYGLANRTR